LPAGQCTPSATFYAIEVSGRFGEEWSEWFGNMTLTIKSSAEGSTITVLSGPVPDRAALFGILNRIRDLGVRLISVNPIDTDA